MTSFVVLYATECISQGLRRQRATALQVIYLIPKKSTLIIIYSKPLKKVQACMPTPSLYHSFVNFAPNSCKNYMNIGANTREITVINLIRMLIDGPEVSLNGSPTVSPFTAAA